MWFTQDGDGGSTTGLIGSGAGDDIVVRPGDSTGRWRGALELGDQVEARSSEALRDRTWGGCRNGCCGGRSLEPSSARHPSGGGHAHQIRKWAGAGGRRPLYIQPMTARGQRGSEESRCDRVRIHAMPRPCLGLRARQLHDGTLRGAVGARIRESADRLQRRDVDDAPPVACDHRRSEALGEKEWRIEIEP